MRSLFPKSSRQGLLSVILTRGVFYLFSCFVLFFLIEYLLGQPSLRIFQEFFPFLYHFFSGDWGISSLYHQNISSFIGPYFLFSCLLGLLSLVSAFIIGLFLALHMLKTPRLSQFLQIFLLGTPITVWAIILNYLFTGGAEAPKSLSEHFHWTNFFLPWIVVTLYHSCSILQMSQFFFRLEVQKPYYQLLKTTSKTPHKLFARYLLKPHLSSIFHNLSLKICILLGGSVGIENFFHIPGTGFLLRKSILEKDAHLLLTASFLILSFITLVYLALGLLKDLFVQKRGHL